EIVQRVDLAVRQAEDGGQNGIDAGQEFRREQVRSGRIEESPVADGVDVLELAAELHLVRALLPGHVVRDRNAVQVAPLWRIEIVPELEIHGVEVEDLRSAGADAVRVQ